MISALTFLRRVQGVADLVQRGGTDGERQAAQAALARLTPKARELAAGMETAARAQFEDQLRQISPALLLRDGGSYFRVGMWVVHQQTQNFATIRERWGSRSRHSDEQMYFVQAVICVEQQIRLEGLVWYESELRTASDSEIEANSAIWTRC